MNLPKRLPRKIIGNFKGALEKLKHDIKPTIEKWLKDYTTETPLQLTKQQILHLVGQMI